MFLKALSTAVLMVLLGALQASPTQSQQHVQELIESLPEYSWVRYELQNGMLGPGKEEPYMQRMRKAGIHRAFYKLTCTWRHGRPQDIRVIRRLYFSEYDGPHAQIRDTRSLEVIRISGAQDFLDQTAINTVSAPLLLHGIHGPQIIRHPEGKQMYTNEQLFDDPALRGEYRPWSDGYYSYKPWPLADAAMDGDANGVQYLLETRQFSTQELNQALFFAVTNYYDNSDVIDLLLRAGANINARDEGGQTPLMIARGRPIEVQILLQRGADFKVRDSRGRTVLRLASDGSDNQAVKLLEQAGARE